MKITVKAKKDLTARTETNDKIYEINVVPFQGIRNHLIKYKKAKQKMLSPILTSCHKKLKIKMHAIQNLPM